MIKYNHRVCLSRIGILSIVFKSRPNRNQREGGFFRFQMERRRLASPAAGRSPQVAVRRSGARTIRPIHVLLLVAGGPVDRVEFCS